MHEKSWKNKLYYGDNLEILRNNIADNFVDLIYLDPPFQSGKNYNIIFQPEMGEHKGATAQIQTFEDTWKWGEEAENNFIGLVRGKITREKPNQRLIDLMSAMRGYLGEVPMMAYLSMMAPRLLEMRRVLKDTGSIYLHCDPTASHYLKLLMDAIFGPSNFVNEIIWGYKTGGISKTAFARKHDTILFYSKSGKYKFNTQYYKSWQAKRYNYSEKYPEYFDKEEGRWYHKAICRDVWEDINPIGTENKERIGYPTQKPESLLERIIQASSDKGDIILDPFCGCGTSIAVSEKFNRKWVGIDITYLAIDVIAKRLAHNGFQKRVSFEINGEPEDEYSAHQLVKNNPFQFQVWCIARLGNATPSQEKTGDKGVDGVINFIEPTRTSKVGKGIIQVKGTDKVNPSMVRDLKGTLESQKADFAILITFREPTQGMKVEALKTGKFKYAQKEIPKVQFLTIKDLLKDPTAVLKLPGNIMEPYRKTPIEKQLQEALF